MPGYYKAIRPLIPLPPNMILDLDKKIKLLYNYHIFPFSKT